MGLLSLECEGGGGGGGGLRIVATVTLFCTDGCFSTCLLYKATKDIERGKNYFLGKNLNNQPWPESELSTITDKCRVAPMDGRKYREAGCPSAGWNAYIVLRRSSVQFQP